jgi:glycosyltransferase involved in cell wall biosynthesis
VTAVTVVVSFKDNASTLLDMVRSVVAQTHADWRLVLLDDGSTDGGADLLSGLADPRVRLVRHAENLGTPVRLNELTDLVDTPFLARMDGDDLMHPERLARSLEALTARPDLSFVAGHAVSIDRDSRPTGLRRSAATPSLPDHFRHAPFVHGTVTARTEWFREHRYDPTFRRCQDQELWVRTIGSRSHVTLDEVLLYLREGGTVPAAKYATSMRGSRRVLRSHGPEVLGRLGTARFAARTLVHEGAYRAADRVGAVDLLVARRATGLGTDERRRHEAEIERIRSVRLPGLD